MSAFILDEKKIAALADYIDCLNFVGFDYFGYSIPKELHDALKLEKRSGNSIQIFNALYSLNVRAVNGRYKDTEPTPEETTIPKDRPTLYHPQDWQNGHAIIKPWHYTLLKLLQCFNYQCCEDATIKDPLYIALEKLEKTLIYYIVENQEEYNNAPWG